MPFEYLELTHSIKLTGWVQSCIERHPQCALPTRVINISDIKALESVFLYESEGESDRYTALSHSWGKMQIIRTTKATIEEMKQSIPWASSRKYFKMLLPSPDNSESSISGLIHCALFRMTGMIGRPSLPLWRQSFKMHISQSPHLLPLTAAVVVFLQGKL